LIIEGDAGPDQGHIVVLPEPTARMTFSGLKTASLQNRGNIPGCSLTLAAPGDQHARWPIVTRYAIPWLYDYLRPFYAVRSYRHGRKRPSAGHYPLKLRQDIRNILRFERADLAGRLTLAHVTAAIQYHLRTAPPNRPVGEQLCAALHGARRRETA